MESEFIKLFRQRLLTFFGGALSLVVALAWNEAVQALFQELFPVRVQGIIAKLGYAVFLTAIVVYVLSKAERILVGEEKGK
jgi:hypothetical protein